MKSEIMENNAVDKEIQTSPEALPLILNDNDMQKLQQADDLLCSYYKDVVMY